MKYVLDASVALAWVIPRPITPKADVLRKEYRNAIHELIAPSTFPAEVASGLTKAERQKVINVGEAIPFLTDILSTSPILQTYDPLLFRAAEISSRMRRGRSARRSSIRCLGEASHSIARRTTVSGRCEVDAWRE